MPKYLAPVDLSGNELQNALLQSLGATPTAVAGRFYLDTSTSPAKLKYYNGTGWVTLDGITVAALDDLSDVVVTSATTGDTLRYNGTNWVNTNFDTLVRANRLDQMAAPTASVGLNSQKITGLANGTAATDAATKGQLDTAIANLIDSAPGTLDTLNELAAALGDDANFASTVTTSLTDLDTRVDALEAATTLRKYSTNIGDGSATTLTVTHSFGTKDVSVSVYENATGDEVYANVRRTTTNAVTVTFTSAPAVNAYRAVVIG